MIDTREEEEKDLYDIDGVIGDQPIEDKKDLDDIDGVIGVQTIEKDGGDDPVINIIAELAGSFNKSIAETLDFFGPDTVNAIAEIAGSDIRVPRISELMNFQGHMKDSKARDYIQSIGETAGMAAGVQGAIRQIPDASLDLAKVFKESVLDNPSFTPKTIDVLKRLPQNMKASIASVLSAAKPVTVAKAAELGAAAGVTGQAGENVGGPTGRVIGEFIAPDVRGIARYGKNYINNVVNNYNNDGLEDYAKHYVYSNLQAKLEGAGIPEDDIPAALKEIGADSIVSDLSDGFQRLTKRILNEIPSFENKANKFLNKRHAGQGQRVQNATENPEYPADIELALNKLDQEVQPIINQKYQEAGQVDMDNMPFFNSLINAKGDLENNIIQKVQKPVRELMANNLAAGKKPSNFDLVNETKKALDDEISKSFRAGGNNKARSIIEVKNKLLEEADNINPFFKEARNLHAGKESLYSAAENGTNFFKILPRDMKELVKTMSDSENVFFKIGARDAIINRIDNTKSTGDLRKKLFGKNGDSEKLRHLFNSDNDFKKYNKALETEFIYHQTRAVAQGNSSTLKQGLDYVNSQRDLQQTIADITTGNWFGLVYKGLKSVFMQPKYKFEEFKKTPAYNQALMDIGDALLTLGDDADKVVDIIKRGQQKEIELALKRIEAKERPLMLRAGRVVGKNLAPLVSHEIKAERENTPFTIEINKGNDGQPN